MTLREFSLLAAEKALADETSTIFDYQKAVDAWRLWERGRETEYEN
ncbi:hypothetical protein HYPP_01481 [Hyphomicrobium sp. ghe19]|nr:hypothetical protein HYPP_01481 [Hyphomicrobium sp. ghe19]